MAQISIVKKSELEGAMRLDAEYYMPKYFQNEAIITASAFAKSTLGELIYPIRNGFDYRDFGESGHPYIRVGDVLFGEVNYRDAVKIDISSDTIKKDVKIKAGDILFSRKGTFGRSAVVEDVFEDSIISSEIMRLRIKDERVDPYYLSTFLNSRIGFLQVERRTHGVSNYSIGQPDLQSVRIIVPPPELQQGIANLVKEAHHQKELSDSLNLQAERLLLGEISFKDLDLSHQLCYTVSFKKTKEASRLDAEYFQPVYDEIMQAVKSAKNYACLGELVSIKKCVEPGSEAYQDSGIPFVRVSNLSKFGINNDNQQYLAESLYETLKMHQPKKGEILLSKDATPGIAYCLREVPGKMIPSSGILRLTVKDEGKIRPEYLTLVLNSVIVQKQIERDAGGSVINHWRVDQVKDAIIPILEVLAQKEISEKIAESFSKREKSKSLLEIAKRKVEDLVKGKGIKGGEVLRQPQAESF